METVVHTEQPAILKKKEQAEVEYDIAVIGGGLAGLSLAIQMSRLGYSVILFEKERYPFHKVCGEYISLESWDFLKQLGLELEQLQVPIIKRLQVSASNGKLLQHDLPLGGFGISRYLVDMLMADIAGDSGTVILENTKVNEINFSGHFFKIETSGRQYRARVACGSYGKRSNIDVKWKRPFTTATRNSLNNYIGVKYHIRIDFPADTIALHNFENGYCGIVKIEGDKYNLCYLTTAMNLKKCGNNIQKLEKTFLMQNPHLKRIFSESEFLFETPLAISQISFDKKTQVDQHMLMIGDAAGMITPLCGNGMSMALHASKLAAEALHLFLQGIISRVQMENQYRLQWQDHFSKRLKMGRWIQKAFGQQWLTNSFVSFCRQFPKMLDILIRQTHGKPF